MPLFLYNFTTRELHGIFTAASDGEWEIDAYGARAGWPAGWPARPWALAVWAPGGHCCCSSWPGLRCRCLPADGGCTAPATRRVLAPTPIPPVTFPLRPAGWTDGGRRTPYPCQVSVAIYQSCPPATADQFRPMIAENMIGNSDKFLVGGWALACGCGGGPLFVL
jgi:hypothetical protein